MKPAILALLIASAAFGALASSPFIKFHLHPSNINDIFYIRAMQRPKGVQIILTGLDPAFRDQVKKKAVNSGMTMKQFILRAIAAALRKGVKA